MQIGKDTVVSLTYELTAADGTLIEKTDQPISYLHGGYDGIFPLIEEALEGQQKGFSTRVRMEPADAFGEYDADLVRMEDRSQFPKNLKKGMQFEGASEESGETRIYTVTDVTDDKVLVDGNHPLAGKALDFALKVTDVRQATGEELTHGHVHGAGGHHH